MIDASFAFSVRELARRKADVLGSYAPGFVPAGGRTLGAPQAVATTDPLSVVAPPDAYFVVADARGERSYTRDGTFRIVEGELVAGDGERVLGLDPRTGDLAPIRIDDVDRALGNGGAPALESDGSLVYRRGVVDPRTGARRDVRVVAGRLALARFPAGALPVRLDATHVAPPSGTFARIGSPLDGSFAALTTRVRDSGGVDPILALERLQEAYDALQACAAAERARSTAQKTSMDLVK